MSEQTLKLNVDGRPYEVTVGDLSSSPIKVIVNGRELLVEVETNHPEGREPAVAPPSAQMPSGSRIPAPSAPAPTGRGPVAQVVAPMPGNIVNIKVKPGQNVAAGQVLCYLEAMKMNNAIHAPRGGVIEEVSVTEGQVVTYGQVLVTYAA